MNLKEVRVRFQTIFAIATCTLSVTACDVFTSAGPKSCDMKPEDNLPTPYKDGAMVNGIYMSSPWTGKLIYFTGGMQVALEHKLGVMPAAWQAYLGFDVNGVKDGPLAPAAGNQVELVGINDQYLTVKNGTCSDFWLLITAEASAPPTPPT